jgi:hypothetical protein
MSKILSIGFILMLLCAPSLEAQKLNGKQKKLLRQGKFWLEDKDYQQAWEFYYLLLQQQPEHPCANYGAGVCMLHLHGRAREAKSYLEKGWQCRLDGAFYMGWACHMQEEFKQATDWYQKAAAEPGNVALRPEIERKMEQAGNALQFYVDRREMRVDNIGPEINTAGQEYAPVLSADEGQLYFTARREGEGAVMDPKGEPFEDVFVTRQQRGGWMPPQRMEEPVNTPTHDATVGLSASGGKLILYRTEEDKKTGELWITEQSASGWSNPMAFPSQINTEFIESSASLSADEQVLYFSSSRPGGFGGKDIYRCKKLPNGEWSLPWNLGPAVNSSQDEESPFIFADDKTLYFSSKGHKGLGGYDIFRSVNGDEGWSVPENIGYPLNTVDDDLFLVVTGDGSRGYFSSERKGGFGGQDIYRVFLPIEPVYSVVHCELKDADGKPVKARVKVFDQDSRRMSGLYNSNEVSGKCILLIEPSKPYELIVESDGYYPEVMPYTTESVEETNLTISLKTK